jgi:hypothetical protein
VTTVPGTRPCLTPGAQYDITVAPNGVCVAVHGLDLRLTEGDATVVERLLHDAVESVLWAAQATSAAREKGLVLP